MIAGIFLSGLIFYSIMAWMSYYDPIKESVYYYPLGILLSIIVNIGWFTIAKIVSDKDDILIYGAFWDSIIIFTFTAVPFLFFGVRLGMKDSIGFGLILAGILVIKFLKL